MKTNLDPKNIIVRMPNWIGDLVMATPILTDLKKAYPSALITVMSQRPLCDLLKEDADVDELFCFTRHKSAFLRRTEKKNIIRKLRGGKYDLGILLTNSFSSAWWFFQGRVKNRIGFKKDFRSFLLDFSLTCQNKKSKHMVEVYKQLLQPLNIPISNTAPRLFTTKKEVNEAYELLYQRGYKKGKTLVGINACAAYGPAKMWPKQRFAAVAKKLMENEDIYVVFIGDQSCVEVVKDICTDLGEKAINLAGATSIRELMSIISLCDAFLTNDSGPMHIASAFNIPLVALFGSTCKIMTGPYKSGEVIDKQVACSPCFKRVCPIDFKCMTKISVDEVYQKLIKLLETRK